MTKLFILLLIFTVLGISTPVFAQAPAGTVETINLGQDQQFGIQTNNPNSSIGNIVRNVILIFFIIGGLAVVIMFLWGAFEWIISGGDKEKIGKARGRIMSALFGLVLLALAFFIISVVGEIVNFNPLTNLTIPVLNAPRR